MEPTIGPPAPPGTRCVHLDDLAAPRCTADATIHVITPKPDGSAGTGLSVCDTHVAIARAAAPTHIEHPHTAACGSPNARVTLSANGANHCTAAPDRPRWGDRIPPALRSRWGTR